MSRRYEELTVWQKAMDLAEQAYAVSARFPAEERYGLATQLRRSVVSIASNIAEGQGRFSKSEFKQFLGIARGSINEARTQMALAQRLRYIDAATYESISRLADDTGNMLNALIKSIGGPVPATRNSKLETRN